MKKIISVLFAFCLCMAASAQQHMKFMGIPLDGTIENFAMKLKAKGVTYDAVQSKKLSPGSKFYRGTFMGERACFVVMFNAKSRLVYGVGVEMSYSSLALAKTPFMNIADKLHTKYPTAVYDRMDKDGSNDILGVSFTIPEENSTELLGIIMQSLKRPDGILTTDWGINLIYTDVKNYKKHESLNNEDL